MTGPSGRRHRGASVRWLLVLLVALVLLPAGPSAARDAGDDTWGVAWDDRPALRALVPGSSHDLGVVVTNERDTDITVELGLVDVRDQENGCLRQERQSDLEDCSTDVGELSSQLLTTITPAGGDPVFDGTLTGLVSERSAPVSVPAGGAVTVEVVVSLPASSTNETMSDRLAFGLQSWAADVTDGEAVAGGVLGTTLDAASGDGSQAGPGSGGPAGLLPATGTVVGLGLVVGSVLLLCVGVALWRAGRRGRKVT